MSDQTIIAWTDRTWNPWRGCAKVSPGCAHCYMFTAQERYGRDPTVVVRSTSTWKDPLKWEQAAAKAGHLERVFTCSWSDWFIVEADPWRDEAWALIRQCPHLQFQILTKREDRIRDHLPADWGDGYPNVWLGVSIENDKFTARADTLRDIPAAVRFISAEPVLGPMPSLDLRGIDWLIVGGESGPNFRPMDHAWVRDLRRLAKQAHTAFFFKQSAAFRTEMGITLDGQVVREYPTPRRLPMAVADAGTGDLFTEEQP
jgi:protein gp37